MMPMLTRLPHRTIPSTGLPGTTPLRPTVVTRHKCTLPTSLTQMTLCRWCLFLWTIRLPTPSKLLWGRGWRLWAHVLQHSEPQFRQNKRSGEDRGLYAPLHCCHQPHFSWHAMFLLVWLLRGALLWVSSLWPNNYCILNLLDISLLL